MLFREAVFYNPNSWIFSLLARRNGRTEITLSIIVRFIAIWLNGLIRLFRLPLLSAANRCFFISKTTIEV